MSVKFSSMGVTAWIRQLPATPAESLGGVFCYALATSGVHQLLLLGLTSASFCWKSSRLNAASSTTSQRIAPTAR